MNKPLVSVVTATYNSAAFIRETIESIRHQTFADWELLITDDCSTDGTLQLLREIAQEDSRIKVFALQVNGGAGVARNHSIDKAGGRFIAFCDSDDQWLPEKLAKQVEFMISKNIAFSYTSYQKMNESGQRLGLVHCLPRLTYADMLRNNYVGCLTAMYDTEKVGLVFMPEVRKRQDWALWLKILKKCGEASGLDLPLAVYRIRSGSISSNKIEMLRYNWVIYYQIERCGLIRSLWLMVVFSWFYLRKKTEGK